MQHEAFFGFAFEAFDALHVVGGAEGGGYQGLGFAAGEDGGTVGAGQDVLLRSRFRGSRRRRARRDGASSRSLLAEDALAQSFVVVLQLRLRVFVIFGNFGLQLLFQSL